MEVDVLSYLNDVDHLSGILFLDTEGEFSWEELKPEQTVVRAIIGNSGCASNGWPVRNDNQVFTRQWRHTIPTINRLFW